MYYFMCVMLTSDVNCLFTPRSEENNGKKTEIIDQPRFHADMQNTSQKCPLISSLTPLFDSTNYLALFRSYQRAIIHCQTFSVATGERNAHFSVLAPRLRHLLRSPCSYLFKTSAICGLSLLLVLSLAPRGFSPGTPVFSYNEPLCGCATSKSLFIIDII